MEHYPASGYPNKEVHLITIGYQDGITGNACRTLVSIIESLMANTRHTISYFSISDRLWDVNEATILSIRIRNDRCRFSVRFKDVPNTFNLDLTSCICHKGQEGQKKQKVEFLHSVS